MIVSSRSDRRRRLYKAAFLASMLLASSVMAQDGNEVGRIAEEARQAFLAGEQGNASARQRVGFYQIARARIKLLEKFAGQGPSGSAELRDGARTELGRLADEGLGHDMISAMLLQASFRDAAGAQSGTDRIEVAVGLHQIASEQKAPAYRVAAFMEIAHFYHKAGAQDRALRYASLALDASGSITDIGAQTGALNAVSRFAIGLGAPGLALANQAIGSFQGARDRAYARHGIARELLKGSAFEKAPDIKVKAEAKKRLGIGDLSGSISLALSLPDSSDRDGLLSDLFEAAANRQDREIALAAAQGFFDSEKQQRTLITLVKEHISRGVPLQAAEIVNPMQDGPERISLQLTLAIELKKAGYNSMADQLFSASSKNLMALDQAGRHIAIPEMVIALTKLERLDEALLYSGSLMLDLRLRQY